MKIGIVGDGVVGGACKFGFQRLGHDVKVHDIKYPGSKIDNIMDSEIIFICVPTPSNDDGSCNTSIVESVIDQILTFGNPKLKVGKQKIQKIIAIKSTVEPGFTDRMRHKYRYLSQYSICFVPEFLRERCSITDFCEQHDLCIVGTYEDEVFDKVKEAHGNFPQQFVKLKPIEAEFCKYFNNVYNATLVTFANSFYEICKKNNVDYTKVKNAMVKRKHISDNYLDCNDNFRGFAGYCLPKDTKVLAKLSEGTNVEFFKMLLKENDKYIKTVFPGMRLEE